MCQTQFHDFLENTGAMISTNLPHKKLNPQLFVFKQNYTKYFICNINQLEGENKYLTLHKDWDNAWTFPQTTCRKT